MRVSDWPTFPTELVLAGLAPAEHGLRPRLFGLTRVSYAVTTFIAFLGPSLNFRQWALDMSPTRHVGNHPGRRFSPARSR